MHRHLFEILNGHRGGVIWFTGLPGSGKTTLADELQKMLLQLGIRCVVLDGDRLRKGLNRDLSFTEQDRMENLRRAAEMAAAFVEAGCLVLAPLISPLESCRAMVRQHFQPADYTELYVKCSLDECMRRDPKGMYQLAVKGIIPDFTGVSAPYEAPSQPDLILDTEWLSVEQCVEQCKQMIVGKIKIESDEEYVI